MALHRDLYQDSAASAICVAALGLLVPADDAGWVALANANTTLGEPVWPVFKKFPNFARRDQQAAGPMSVHLSATGIDDGSSEPRMPNAYHQCDHAD